MRDDAVLDHRPFDQWRVGAAADVQGPFGLFINLQYLYDEVQDAPDGLVRPQRDHVVTAFLRRTFSYERIATELRWYSSAGEGDGMVRAEIAYVLGNSTSGAWSATRSTVIERGC
ncbi:MAG: hypothetical protein U5Q16_16130 [Gammaproteobacteria bacterium]|nr:hypothetical protein [Gammaproteobacteria bacterium]